MSSEDTAPRVWVAFRRKGSSKGTVRTRVVRFSWRIDPLRLLGLLSADVVKATVNMKENRGWGKPRSQKAKMDIS